MDYITDTKGSARYPGIATLGFIAGFDETLALGIITSKGIAPLKEALQFEQDEKVKEDAAWTLGRIGMHSGQHARAMAEADIFKLLLSIQKSSHTGEDLKRQSGIALKLILQQCTYLPALEPLIQVLQTASFPF